MEKIWNKKDLRTLFDNQIKVLLDFKVPDKCIKQLLDMNRSVIKKAAEIPIENNNIPFIPVLQLKFFDKVFEKMISNNTLKLLNLELSEICNFVKMPDIYYIYNIGDSFKRTLGWNGRWVLEHSFLENERRYLTLVEIFTLIICDYLSSFVFLPLNSGFIGEKDNIYVPVIQKEEGIITFTIEGLGCSCPSLLSPSCWKL